MTPSPAAAPLQSGPDPLLELVLELLLEVLLELLLSDSVSATTNREPSEATATSAPAPRSAYMSFDIYLLLTMLPAAGDGTFQFEAGAICGDRVFLGQDVPLADELERDVVRIPRLPCAT